MKLVWVFCSAVLLLAACGKKSINGTGPWFHTTTVAHTQSIHDDSTQAGPYYERGVALRKLQEDSLALLDFRTAILRDSNKAEYYSAAGDLLFDHKDISGSVPYFQRALAHNPQDPQAHLKLATVMLFTKDHQKAFQEINTVLRQEPRNAEAYFLKGMVYKSMEDTGHAISSFNTALNMNPRYPDALMQLGLMYTGKGDSTGLLYLNNAFGMDSTDLAPLYARGMFYQQRGDWENAKTEYARMRAHDKTYVDAWYNTGYVLLQQDSPAVAIRYFDNAVQLNPNNPGALYNRGLCKELTGDRDGARNDYRQALKASPEFANAKAGLKRVGE